MKHWYWLWMLLVAGNARADMVGHHEGARELLLSGNGKVALSSGEDGTRVWDFEGKRELPMVPVQAGNVVAIAEDGERVLCRRSERKAEQEHFVFTLWRRSGSAWQKGTLVRASTIEPLLDAVFVNSEAVLLWQQSIERRGADGRLRCTMRWKEIAEWPYRDQVSVGALSRDGTRAVVSGFVREQAYAFIYEVSTGRPQQKLKLDQMAWRTAWKFSPEANVVGAVIGEWVEPWGPNDGPQPAQFKRSLWNVGTGDELSSSFDLSLTFWPNGGRAVLVRTANDEPSRLELYDVSSGKVLPLPFPQPWRNRALKGTGFSRDGRTLSVLDEKGDIWVEQMRDFVTELKLAPENL